MNSIDLASMQRAFDSMNPVLRGAIRAMVAFGEAIRRIASGLHVVMNGFRRMMQAIVRGIAELPAHPTAQLQPRRVQMPMFELHSNPTINLQEIRHRRFNIIDRTEPPDPPDEDDTRRAMLRVLSERSKHIPKTIWERLVE